MKYEVEFVEKHAFRDYSTFAFIRFVCTVHIPTLTYLSTSIDFFPSISIVSHIIIRRMCRRESLLVYF